MPPARIDLPGCSLIEDASLAERNTLRVAARCAWFAELHDASVLPALLARPALHELPLLVLGAGSNVLFTADWPGLVVHPRDERIEWLGESDGYAHVRAGAGVNWDHFVRWTLAHELMGLENLVQIPGTVGAAPIQNIGAYGVEVATCIEHVEAWDRHARSWVRLDAAACSFSYRDSCFKQAPDRWIIRAVHFVLPRVAPLQIEYAGIREELAAMRVDAPRAVHVAEAVARLRARKLPDPTQIGNAGSFFKNPEMDPAQAASLQARLPELPAWPADHGRVKLSAAWLIERAGCKGLRQGDAGISARHALVLVNHGHASGAELWALAQQVREAVHALTGIWLEPEPRILP